MVELVAETQRLRLRGWRNGDREEFVRHLNTPAVMRWLGGIGTQAHYDAAFDRLDGYQRDYGHTFWIVERKSDGALLGFCGLKRVNSAGATCTGDFEIGWRLREDWASPRKRRSPAWTWRSNGSARRTSSRSRSMETSPVRD